MRKTDRKCRKWGDGLCEGARHVRLVRPLTGLRSTQRNVDKVTAADCGREYGQAKFKPLPVGAGGDLSDIFCWQKRLR